MNIKALEQKKKFDEEKRKAKLASLDQKTNDLLNLETRTEQMMTQRDMQTSLMNTGSIPIRTDIETVDNQTRQLSTE